ncbi:hypothetical protein Q2941_39975 [Bradyrhizobium sp. UFLA05-153]
MALPVEIGSEHVDLLVSLRWLPPRDTYQQEEIVRALQAMVDDAAARGS